MEILTREKLTKIIDERCDDVLYAADILDEDLFEETDQFEVSRLRPMGALDDYDGVDVLAYNKVLNRFVHFSYDNIAGGWLIHALDQPEFSGFIPMPKHTPEG